MNRAVLTKIFMIYDYDTYTRLELQHFRKNKIKWGKFGWVIFIISFLKIDLELFNRYFYSHMCYYSTTIHKQLVFS